MSEGRAGRDAHSSDGVGQPPDVLEGCKHTEVGVIPEDWEVNRIDQHTSIKTGSRNTQDNEEGGEYPFFVRSQEVERIDTYSYDGEAVLTAGDGVGTGKVFHYIRGRFDVHQRVYRISDFSDQLNGRYFFFQFSERFYHRIMSMTAKSSVDSVRMEMIAGMRIPMPPAREQRAIAAVLSDVDELIGSLEALIAKKRAIKQAAMQQLLTGRTRLPGFGGEWETHRLGDLGEVSGAGVDKKTRPEETPVRLLNYLDVYRKTFIRSRDLTQTVSAPDRQVLRCTIARGDVFLTPTSEVPNDIGRPALAVEDIADGVYSYHVVRFRPHVDWDLRFRAFVFDTEAFRIQTSKMAEGSGTRYVITLPRFRSLLVSYPPTVAEQRAIATVLSEMDAEIAALERRLDKTRAIKQGMMQQLLTGSIRLPIPGDEMEDDHAHDA